MKRFHTLALQRRWTSQSEVLLRSLVGQVGWGAKSGRLQDGSLVLSRPGYPDLPWPFRPGQLVGARDVARIARLTGIEPDQLRPPQRDGYAHSRNALR